MDDTRIRFIQGYVECLFYYHPEWHRVVISLENKNIKLYRLREWLEIYTNSRVIFWPSLDLRGLPNSFDEAGSTFNDNMYLYFLFEDPNEASHFKLTWA